MRLLILPFALLKGLFVKNPFKAVVLVFCIVFWHYAGTFKPQKSETLIYHEFVHDGQWFGVYGYDPDVFVLNEKPKLVGKEKNMYVSHNEHPANVLLWFGFGLTLLFIIIGSFIEDGWGLDDVMRDGLSVFVRCDIEDGAYVYTVFGRLLAKYKNPVDNVTFYQLRSVSSILSLPKYETKMSKRDRLLRIIGI